MGPLRSSTYFRAVDPNDIYNSIKDVCTLWCCLSVGDAKQGFFNAFKLTRLVSAIDFDTRASTTSLTYILMCDSWVVVYTHVKVGKQPNF